jgi:hypothetical protein
VPGIASRVALAFLPLVAGCSAEHKNAVTHFGALICRTAPDTAVVAIAVRGYVHQLDPLPRRFLYIPATDSSPPDPVVATIQDLGPTYVYSTDPKLQAPLRKVLDAGGDYATLLLAYHGFARPDPMHPVVTLSGHYVTGGDDGKDAGRRTIALQCDSSGWYVPERAGGSAAGAARDTHVQ